MQGSCCWSGYFFNQNPTSRRSIFTRPSRVKNALAFLHRVFTNIFALVWLITESCFGIKGSAGAEPLKSPSCDFGVNASILC